MKENPSTELPKLAEQLVEKNLQAIAEIQDSAQELAVVHAVLTTELKHADSSDEAQSAVERTHEVKAQLDATAAKLEEATKALSDQIPEKDSSQ